MPFRPPPAPVLAYPGSNVFNAQLHLADRRGVRTRVGAARLYSNLWPSARRGGHIVAVPILEPGAGTHDLSLIDLSTDAMEPLTTTRGWTGANGESGAPERVIPVSAAVHSMWRTNAGQRWR
jgi:hypothetical protein